MVRSPPGVCARLPHPRTARGARRRAGTATSAGSSSEACSRSCCSTPARRSRAIASIEELWGEDPPADAADGPAAARLAAAQAARAARRARDAGARGTRSTIDPEQLDLERFQRLRADGRRQLEEGRPADGGCASAARRRFELWRGPTARRPRRTSAFARDGRPRPRGRARLAGARERASTRTSRWVATPSSSASCAALVACASAPRAPPRAADARAVPVGPPGGGARGLRRRAPDARRRSSASSPARSSSGCSRTILAHDDVARRAPRRPAARRRRRVARARGDGCRLGALAAAVVAAVAARRDESDGVCAVTAGGGALRRARRRDRRAIERRIPAGRTPSAIAVRRRSPSGSWTPTRGRVLRVVPTPRASSRRSRQAPRRPTSTVGRGLGVGRERPSAPECAVRRAGRDGGRAAGPDDRDRTGTASAATTAAARCRTSSRTTWRRPRMPCGRSRPNFRVVRIDAATRQDHQADWTRVPAARDRRRSGAGVWVARRRRRGRTARRADGAAASGARLRAGFLGGSIAVGDDAAWVTSPADGHALADRRRSAKSLGAIELDRRHLATSRSSATGVWVANPLAGHA